MVHPKMLEAFPPHPEVRDVVEILRGPHAGMTGRIRSITNGRARVMFSSTKRSVLVSLSYLKEAP